MFYSRPWFGRWPPVWTTFKEVRKNSMQLAGYGVYSVNDSISKARADCTYWWPTKIHTSCYYNENCEKRKGPKLSTRQLSSWILAVVFASLSLFHKFLSIQYQTRKPMHRLKDSGCVSHFIASRHGHVAFHANEWMEQWLKCIRQSGEVVILVEYDGKSVKDLSWIDNICIGMNWRFQTFCEGWWC